MTTIAKLMGTGVPPAQAQATVAGVPSGTLTASGTNQATAALLASDFSVFTTVAAGTGARLPTTNPASMTALAGDIYVVVNNQATNALTIYPPTGGSFAGAAASVSIAAGKTGDFYCLGANAWAPSVGG